MAIPGMGTWFSGLTGTGQPEKTGLTARNRPHILRFKPEKTGAFQPEPPGKSPVQPKKTARIFGNRKTGCPSLSDTKIISQASKFNA